MAELNHLAERGLFGVAPDLGINTHGTNNPIEVSPLVTEAVRAQLAPVASALFTHGKPTGDGVRVYVGPPTPGLNVEPLAAGTRIIASDRRHGYSRVVMLSLTLEPVMASTN